MDLENLFLFLIFFSVFMWGFYKILTLQSKPRSKWSDVILSLVGSLVYSCGAFVFVISHSGPFLGELMPLLISAGLAIVFVLFILWQVFKNKRFGLLTSIGFMLIFCIGFLYRF